MSSTQITFTVPDEQLKNRFMAKTKSQGLAMKTAFIAFMKDYTENSFEIKLVKKHEGMHEKSQWRDDMMTEENRKNYIQAKKDFENGVNIVSWEELKAKHLL